jgi:hypothetical protein
MVRLSDTEEGFQVPRCIFAGFAHFGGGREAKEEESEERPEDRVDDDDHAVTVDGGHGSRLQRVSDGTRTEGAERGG